MGEAAHAPGMRGHSARFGAAGLAALDDLRGAVLAPSTAAELVPPPRFAAKTFATYRTDAALPAQAAAVERVRHFATARRPLLGWLPFRAPERKGLYLDGGFGVGKTHLLAASFHAAHGRRSYLSFAEAISLVVLRGAGQAAELLAADLVCIDEFELDDPANTRLADLLLEQLVRRGCRIVTTSNTVPGELGLGRMAVDQFRNQLARIADVFEDVHVPGLDHRLRGRVAGDADPAGWGPAVKPWDPAPTAFVFTADELDTLLSRIPIANLRRLAMRLGRLTITGLMPFADQLAALRFVHLVDKLYDSCTALRVITPAPLSGLFPEEHCQRAFAKKYQRCSSRLVELCV